MPPALNSPSYYTSLPKNLSTSAAQQPYSSLLDTGAVSKTSSQILLSRGVAGTRPSKLLEKSRRVTRRLSKTMIALAAALNVSIGEASTPADEYAQGQAEQGVAACPRSCEADKPSSPAVGEAASEAASAKGKVNESVTPSSLSPSPTRVMGEHGSPSGDG
jgi:hypothetical protein